MNHFLGFMLLLAAGNVPAQVAPAGNDGYIPYPRLVQCLRAQQQVAATGAELQAEKLGLDRNGAVLEQQHTALNRSGEQLALRIRQKNLAANQAPPASRADGGDPRLDHYLRQHSGTNGERRRHNKAVAAHHQKQDAHNAQVGHYNRRIAGLNQQRQIVDRNCAGAKVRPGELARARAELAAESPVVPTTMPAAPAPAP